MCTLVKFWAGAAADPPLHFKCSSDLDQPWCVKLVSDLVVVDPLVEPQQLRLLVWCRGALSGALPHRPQWL